MYFVLNVYVTEKHGTPTYLQFITENFPDGLWGSWQGCKLFSTREQAEEYTKDLCDNGFKPGEYEIKELR